MITLRFFILTAFSCCSALVGSVHADLALNGNFESLHEASSTEDAVAPAEWKILKTEWSSGDEARFSDFVAAIGKSGCRSADQCLKSSANPYRASDSATMKFFTDCADLPYYLRAYFSWKNGLPFSYLSDVEAVAGTASRDIRYSPKGNRATDRVNIYTRVNADGTPLRANGTRVLHNIQDRISSAIYRIGPPNEDLKRPTDLYPVAPERGRIRPGTVIYDPAGHVALVYSVEEDGRILFIDAHPDNSITRGTFGKKFSRSSPGQGAGFKNWRPIKLVDARLATGVNAVREYIGGTVTLSPNTSLDDYSVVQYYGTNPDPKGSWKNGQFIFDAQVLDYYDYLRRALANGSLSYDPLKEFALYLRGLCADLKDRATSVELAVAAGIDRKQHPPRLPSNIYGSTGEWEDYATPSRDARLKTSFKEAYDRAAEFLARWKSGDGSIVYAGTDLKSDLRRVLQAESAACEFHYRKSDGTEKALNLYDAGARLFAISFDPYHCPELRWGATAGDELASCPHDPVKTRWYDALRRLRNQIERTYDARMDFTLDQMLDAASGGSLGAETPPSTDLEALLR